MIKKVLSAIAIVAMTASGAIAAESTPDIPSEVTLFKNVQIFDGTTDKLKTGLDVLVVKNKIHKIAKNIPVKGTWAVKPGTREATQLTAPAGGDYTGGYRFLVQSDSGEMEAVDVKATVIDGGGRTLMPGLIDAHTHLNMQFGGHGTDRGIQGMQNLTWEEIGALAYESAREFLPAGVTTVRDLCGMSQGLRKHIDSGTLEGPRIYTSGTCLGQSSGHGDWRWDPAVLRDDGSKSNLELLGITKLTDGADEVLKASRNNLAAGADFVKMMSGGGVTSERDPIESVQGTIVDGKFISNVDLKVYL